MNINKLPSPAYILDEAKLISNLSLINRVQEEAGVSIILALKGFAMWRTFPLVANYLSGATASSLHEARLIYEEMGVKAHIYAVAYNPDEFPAMLRYSGHLSFNSIRQFEFFYPIVREYDVPISCGLRVNPEYSEVEVDLYNPAASGSRLGEAPPAVANGVPAGVEGLHFHTLCESSSYDLEKLLVAFEHHFGHLLPDLKWVNMGGGHLMTRNGYEVDHLIQVLKDFKKRYPHLEVILEPGSAIAWDTGVLVTTVMDIHEARGIKTAIINASFTAHMPDTLEMPYRPNIQGASSEPQAGKPAYRIGGVSCLAGDYLEAYSFDQELKIGDRIILEDMIHYTMVKTTMFNGVKHPAIGIWRKEGRLEMIREFDYEDYKNRLS